MLRNPEGLCSCFAEQHEKNRSHFQNKEKRPKIFLAEQRGKEEPFAQNVRSGWQKSRGKNEWGKKRRNNQNRCRKGAFCKEGGFSDSAPGMAVTTQTPGRARGGGGTGTRVLGGAAVVEEPR